MPLSILRESAKSYVSRAYVLVCFKCIRAWHACVLRCFCALQANALACLAYLHAYVLGVLPFLACLQDLVFGVLTWLCDDAFSMLACFLSLLAHVFYMLAVLKYLTCLCECVLLWRFCPIFFTLEKLNCENFHIEKFLFIQKKYSESTYWASMNEFFQKKLWPKAFNYF